MLEPVLYIWLVCGLCIQYSLDAFCQVLTALYCKLHIGHLNSTFGYFCLCFGNHWLRVRREGREMDLLPRLFQVQGLCLLWANMAAEFALDVIQETFGCLDSCQGGDYSRIVLWLEYLNHTLINSGELPDSIVAFIGSTIACLSSTQQRSPSF